MLEDLRPELWSTGEWESMVDQEMQAAIASTDHAKGKKVKNNVRFMIK